MTIKQKFNPNLPFGTIVGEYKGYRYEQNGVYFDHRFVAQAYMDERELSKSEVDELVDKTIAARAAAEAATVTAAPAPLVPDAPIDPLKEDAAAAAAEQDAE